MKGRNCYFGAKVVRGAYLEKERFLAAKQGYEDPINPTYESTGEMYNRVIDHMIEYISSNEGKDGGHVVIATHNEVGIQYFNDITAMLDTDVNLSLFENLFHVCFTYFQKDGVWNAVKTMQRLGVNQADERVSFGQIYGMGEQLSIPLGDNKIEYII